MSHNHKPFILHHDSYAYVACCPGCMCFQLGFGNVYLNQRLEDLKAFAQLINKHNHQYLQRKDRKTKDIFIDGPDASFGLVLSANELERVNHILQKTLLILATKNEERLQ